MAIFYDPPSRKWNITYEKIDYKTDNKTDYPTDLPETFEARNPDPQKYVTKYVSKQVPVTRYRTEYKQQSYTDYEDQCTGFGSNRSCRRVAVTKYKDVPVTVPYTAYEWQLVPESSWQRDDATGNANIAAMSGAQIIQDARKKWRQAHI